MSENIKNGIKIQKMLQNMYKHNQIETIEFVPPVKKDTYIEDLRIKYLKSDNQLKKDKINIENKILISNPDLIIYKWLKYRTTSVGFKNVGNTCFLNSILQIFIHTAPFYNYINQKTHKQECKN